jgi:fucose 4-O-acetylase-like acetyltransferase
MPLTARQSGRSAFIDNLRVLLTILVIVHHAGQPYGPTGGAWPLAHAEKFRLLGPFFHINASFFMGLFFLISAYYLPASYNRKGPRRFLLERVRRLGIPIVLFVLGFVPLVRHVIESKPWRDCFWPFEWAHLWFLGHLLVYALAYCAFRALSARLRAPAGGTAAKSAEAQGGLLPFPGNVALLAYAAALALVSTAVRIEFPIDRWVHIGVPAEIAHLPQYASLFVFGLVASRQRWLERIPAAIGRTWLMVGVALIALRFTLSVLWLRQVPALEFLRDDGLGVDLVWNTWEALLCTGLCVGLPWLFRTRWDHAGLAMRFFAREAFVVYVIHLPILVFVQMALEKTSFGPLTLTLLSATIAVTLCYATAAALATVIAGARSLRRRLWSARVRGWSRAARRGRVSAA